MNLETLRNEIDKIDDNIAQLLKNRMEIVLNIGKLKAQNNSVVYRPEREEQIIKRLQAKFADSNLNAKGISSIFYEIFSLARSLENTEKIAFLGPVGTYTHEAGLLRFGNSANFVAFSNIEAVFKEVSSNSVKFGIVPVENNTEGTVGISLDCLKSYEDIKIIGEIYIDINHYLASLCDNIQDIQCIYSHPQAYAQCRNFLNEHNLENVEFIATNSTAQAALLAQNNKFSAAICSKASAKIYEIPIIFEQIQDNNNNRTRFFIISNFECAKSIENKTSILAFNKHKPGALFEMLSIFKAENINITKLESRPMKQKSFRSLFYLDFEGHKDDENIKRALQIASNSGHEIRVLGSYAKSE